MSQAARCGKRARSTLAGTLKRQPQLMADVANQPPRIVEGRPKLDVTSVQRAGHAQQVTRDLGRELGVVVARHPSRWRQLAAGVNGELGRCLSEGRS